MTWGELTQSSPGANVRFAQTNKESGFFMQNTNGDWTKIGATGAADPTLKDGAVRMMDYKINSGENPLQLQANGTYKFMPTATGKDALNTNVNPLRSMNPSSTVAAAANMNSPVNPGSTVPVSSPGMIGSVNPGINVLASSDMISPVSTSSTVVASGGMNSSMNTGAPVMSPDGISISPGTSVPVSSGINNPVSPGTSVPVSSGINNPVSLGTSIPVSNGMDSPVSTGAPVTVPSGVNSVVSGTGGNTQGQAGPSVSAPSQSNSPMPSKQTGTAGLQGSTPHILRTSDAYIVGGGNKNGSLNTAVIASAPQVQRVSDPGFKGEAINPDSFVAQQARGVDTRSGSDRGADFVHGSKSTMNAASGWVSNKVGRNKKRNREII